ncbi:MAG: PQQ-binding-like beta-propeller repeat protein [Hyphomicrobiales bacterium]
MARASELAAAVAACCMAAALLAGCSTAKDLNPFKKPEEILPGDRIAVIKPEENYQVDQAAARKPVALPPATRNAEWLQPGGVASNAPGHLELSGASRTAWQVDAGSGSSDRARIIASPLVHEGRVYVLDSSSNVTAFSAAGGGRMWRVSLVPEGERGGGGYGGGMAIDGGQLYVGTGYGVVVALNPSNGATVWTQNVGVPIRTSPTAANGRVFVVSTEGQLFSLDAADGKQLFTFRGSRENATLLNNVSPAVSGDIVVVPFPSGDLMAYRIPEGRPAWVDSLGRSSGGAAGSTLASLSDPARPVIDKGIVYAVGHAGRMIAASATTGERVWTKNLRGTQMPWVAGDTVFVVDTAGNLMALTRAEGAVRWVTQLPQSGRWNGPVLGSGRLWLVSSRGLLVSVDAATGQLGSQTNLDTTIFIAPIVAGGRMYILTDAGRLLAMD